MFSSVYQTHLFTLRNSGTKLSSMSNKYSTAPISRLKGKVAIVTASTDGIGFAIAKRLGAEGASVVVSSRKEKNVNEATKKLKDSGYSVAGTVCHVAKNEDRKLLFQTCPEEAWDKIFDVNVKSAFMLSKEVLPHLKKRNGGCIVYISSIAGFHPLSLLGAYSVSKTALLGLTKAAAVDLAPDNIRVNCLAPGIVQTRFSSALHETETAKEIAMSMIPMKRLAQPDEMASVVAFLCSEDASYITGETFIAAGGMASRL
ncbi:dehydrogenase/reductase SDR family member 4 isoform X2 [Macrosteles quadrilineatus]|uniref:dehydrogenase/reductase SDR family member 4 isoform X2 n=1 Tax=Macrosteles quadrilineatus TaxID=74068 RepID=UPI0023E1DDFB|nr:dehydrogenase/reductase SDR family member 4 isoform X2 [Macrosteles quadrilineatus]